MKYFDPPDHHVDRGHHGVPLGDEAVENVAVEDSAQDSYGGEQRPESGELVLALQGCPAGHIGRGETFWAGRLEQEQQKDQSQRHQSQPGSHCSLSALLTTGVPHQKHTKI